MEHTFDQKLRQARVRCGLNRLLRQLADALLVLAVAALVVLLVERLFAVTVLGFTVVGVALGLSAVAVFLWWHLTRPGVMRVALMIDERLALRERFSTTLALAGVEEPFVVAARQEAFARAAQADVRRSFPVKLTTRWYFVGGAWAAVLAVLALMPTLDLLGHKESAKQAAAQQKLVEQAKADVKQTVSKVESLTTRLNAPELATDLSNLTAPQKELTPAEVRRDTIRRLGDLAEALKQLQKNDQAQAMRNLQDMMKNLRSSPEGLANDLSKALQQGDFGKAADLAKQLREKLTDGKLSPEDREKLAKDLVDLAAQMEKVAAQQKELEDALQQAGLDKKLAQLSEQELRQKLAQAGLDQATIDRLIEKMKACKLASANCRGLGKALAGCCGGAGGMELSPEALAALADKLDDLEALRARLGMMQAALNETEDAIALLGFAGCQGGAKGLFAPGQSDEFGLGSGGPGHGSGPVDTAAGGPTGNTPTKVKNPDKVGPIIAVWESKEEQIKGEAKQELKDVIQAAKDSAAEAINENQIPARYQPAVERYFNDLEKTGGGNK